MPTRLLTFCVLLLTAIAVATGCCAASPATSVILVRRDGRGDRSGQADRRRAAGRGAPAAGAVGARRAFVAACEPNQASTFDRTSSRFRPYPPSEFRAALLRELGNKYEVTGTTHYLIAHPRGQQSRWAERFEELYRSFIQYFSVRGFEPATPPFPLAGIVCGNRGEFDRLVSAARRRLFRRAGILQSRRRIASRCTT